MLTEKDMLDRLASELPSLPPLTFKREPDAWNRGVDAVYAVSWNGYVGTFVAEVKARGTPLTIMAASQRAKSLAFDVAGALPLVIVPYLSPAQLDQIEALDGVSAIDLCGNGLVRISHHLFVLRSGRPNRFPEAQPLKAAYRGTSSLVARSLALHHRFESVSAIRDFITSHGGGITLGTVSKALARLGEDLVVERKGRAVQVLQPEKLLEQLRQSYRPPRIKSRWSGKLPLTESAVHARFLEHSERTGNKIVLTGVSSARHYVPIATEPVAAFYCSIDPHALLRAARIDATPTRTFPNVELLQTDDDSVYFDPRIIDHQIISSPLQVWLELVTGDKRTREASEGLRVRLTTGGAQPVEG